MNTVIDTHYYFADFFDSPQVKTLAYELSLMFEQGNICLSYQQLQQNIAKNNNPFYQKYNLSIDDFSVDQLLNEDCITTDKTERKPFVFNNDNFYIQRYFQYETEIIDQIHKFILVEEANGINTEELIRHTDFILSLFDDYEPNANSIDENIQWQCVAAITSVISNFSIITGGPGTGKTTTVAKVLALLYTIMPQCNVALAAPTGKAAARMKESLIQAKNNINNLGDDIKEKFEQIEAGTIHRMLGYIKNSPYFKANSNNPLNVDVVIVDESSMIGTALMAKMITAVNPNAKIILLGDKNQLASVEAGSIFGDICFTQNKINNQISKSRAIHINHFINKEKAKLVGKFISSKESNNLLQNHIVELKRSYRFKGEEAIGIFSKAVVNGKLNDEIIEQCNTSEGQTVSLSVDYDVELRHQLYSHYYDYIHEQDIAKALDKFNKVRILCAVKEGEYGVNFYNEDATNFLQNKGWIEATKGFYHNQPIMISRNDYQLHLYNGDIGIIRNNEKGELIAYFETTEGITKVHTARLNSYQTVYAMTIHKSQGSEFKHVGVVLPNDEDSQILTRELIYTGITRAKQSAIIFGPKSVLLKGVSRRVKRASGITSRLLNII